MTREEIVARAMYERNPICGQNVDADGRPVGVPFEYSWESLDEVSPEHRQSLLEAARAAIAAYESALRDEGYVIVKETADLPEALTETWREHHRRLLTHLDIKRERNDKANYDDAMWLMMRAAENALVQRTPPLNEYEAIAAAVERCKTGETT